MPSEILIVTVPPWGLHELQALGTLGYKGITIPYPAIPYTRALGALWALGKRAL